MARGLPKAAARSSHDADVGRSLVPPQFGLEANASSSMAMESFLLAACAKDGAWAGPPARRNKVSQSSACTCSAVRPHRALDCADANNGALARHAATINMPNQRIVVLRKMVLSNLLAADLAVPGRSLVTKPLPGCSTNQAGLLPVSWTPS